MANTVSDLNFALLKLLQEIASMVEETKGYIKNPDQLAERTIELSRFGVRLQSLMNIANNTEHALKEILVGNSWLNGHLEPKMSMSAVESGKEDLEYLRCVLVGLKSEISYQEKARSEMLNLVS